MPLDQKSAQQYFANKGVTVPPPPPAGPADFAKPPKSFDEQINAMPNAGKLTDFEKGVYKALPGFTTWMQENKLFGKTISERMANFDKSFIGKTLGWLDIGAEGLERTVGLAKQIYSDPDFDYNELKAAWYAGSLTGDMTNLPQLSWGQKMELPGVPAGVKFPTGIRIPEDLPGSGGLNDARAKIQQLMDAGMDPKEALAKTRDEYYNGLGALALRAQINDMWFHVVGDPLNVLSAYFKPVELLKAKSIVALTSKVEDVGEFAKAADKAFDLVRTAENAEDALKYADEAASLAQLAGDTKKAAQFSEEAASLAQKLGKTEDLARYTEDVGKFTTMTAEDAARFSDDALKALGKKRITAMDRVAIMLSGGDPFRPSEFGKKLSKIPGIGKVAEAFRLTPESKAKELMSVISDNLGRTIGQMMNNPNAEADFVGFMRRLSKGSSGIEYGHAFLSVEGRTVQSFLSGGGYDLEKMLSQYEALATTRSKLELLTKTLGQSPEKLFGMLNDNPEAVMQMLAKYAPNNPALAQMLQTGELNADALKRLTKLKDVPYNREMFFAKALDAIETASMRQAVVQFGVQSKGVVSRWSDAVKAAESLAFLRLNPGYPIRNKINNDVTLVARGLFGMLDDTQIDDFWKGFGQVPKRLEDAISPAQLEKVQGAMTDAEKILQEAISGGNYGAPEKVKEFFQKMNLGQLDFAKNWGQKFETQAGRKAFTLGTKQFLQRLYKPKAAREYLNPKVIDDIADIAPEFEKSLNNAIRSAGGMDSKLDDLLGTNLNLSVDNILDDVTASLGTDVRQMLGDETLGFIHNGLPKAIQENRVDSFIQEARQVINRHIDDLFNKQIENVVEHTKAQAMAGGPNVWNRYLAKAQDIFWGAHVEHSIRMPEATRLAREASSVGDFAAARVLWQQEAEDARLFYNRAFKRVDAYVEGLEQGTAELARRGAKVPFTETRKTFKRWRGLWEDFFTKSNKLKDDFWEAVSSAPAGQKPVWDDVQAELDGMYNKVIGQEDELGRGLDDTIAGMIDNPDARTAFTNARDQLAQLKKQDKELMIEMRQTVNDLPAELRQDAWNDFWQQRQGRYQAMRQVDAESIIIQQGDPNTIGKYIEAQETSRTATRTAEEAQRVADEAAGIAPAGPVQRASQSTVNPNFIADVNKVIPDPAPVDLSLDMMAYGRQYGALDDIARSAKTQAQKTPALLKNLPEGLQGEVMKAVKNIKNDFATTRHQALKFGEWRRDSALLNYNRRTNFDAMLGNVAPFSFWTTHSSFIWAVESIDRPAMLTNYMRMREFFATAGLERDGMASRAKGKLRIDLPFTPDWMGEQFIDPLRVALPFDNWISPFEQWEKGQNAQQGRTMRVLDQLYQEGKITDEDYEEAKNGQSGAAWDFAESVSKQNDDSDNYDAWDFATTLAAPHAPIMLAYNAAFGDKKDIGPFTPVSKMARNAATLLGVEDWNNSKWNLEAKVRKQLGLPAFDKFDNYRIKRAASSLAGDGILTADEAMEAITLESMVESGKLTPEEAKKQSEAYRLSVKRSNEEYTGGVGAFALGLFGLSVTSVPTGENEQRKLQDDFGNAYGKYKAADESLDKFLAAHPMMDSDEAAELWQKQNPKLAKDADALGDFFDAHPEYESRLSLFDKPEEQIHNFMIDQIWKRYNELPKVNQDEAREHLGTDFQDAFLNSNTRDYGSIDTATMQVWLKLMGTDPLGGLTADQRMLTQLYGKVQFTEPETAQRVQVFYDKRKQDFPEYSDLQSEYYKLPKGSARKQFLNKNPELRQYFNWRTQFMNDNPDILPFLTDDEKAIQRAKNKVRTQNAVPTAAELKNIAATLPPSAQELLVDSLNTGEPLPPVLVGYLDELAQAQGLSVDQFVSILGSQYAQP